MNLSNRCFFRPFLKSVSDSEEVREEGKEFQRRRPEKAKADLAKECLTDRIKKRKRTVDQLALVLLLNHLNT